MLRGLVAVFGLHFLTLALFPRTGYRFLYWPAHHGPRGTLAWVVGNMAVKFAIFAWLPRARRTAAEYERELAGLGHKPDDREMMEIYHRARQAAAGRADSRNR